MNPYAALGLDFAIAAYALLCLRATPGETDLGKAFFTRKAA